MTNPDVRLIAQACGLSAPRLKDHLQLLGLADKKDPGTPPEEARPWWERLQAGDPVDPAALSGAPTWAGLDDVTELLLEPLERLTPSELAADERRAVLNNVSPCAALLLDHQQRHGRLPERLGIVHVCDARRWGHVVEGLLVLRLTRFLVDRLRGEGGACEVDVALCDVSLQVPGGAVVSAVDEDALIAHGQDNYVLLAEEAYLAAVLPWMPWARSAALDVYTNLVAGASLGKNLLGNATMLTAARPAWKFSHRGPDGASRAVVSTEGLFEASAAFSSVHDRVGRAVNVVERERARTSGPALTPARLAAQGVAGLVEIGPEGVGLGPAVDAITATADFQRPLLRSACAGVLWRAGEGVLAERLEELIEQWQRADLWKVNLVPEMVLHDEAHSATVDRHLSIIGGALLETGRFPASVFMALALSAWLHDWGHMPVAIGNKIATSPAHVRAIHGLQTRQLLRRTDLEKVHGLRPVEAAWVGLLSAHHQGWTSCADEKVTPSDPQRRALDRAGLGGGPPSFHDDVAAARDHVDTSGDVHLHEKDLRDLLDVKASASVLHLALALVRLCDGADVGMHRVPNWRTARLTRDIYWQAPLADFIELAETMESAGKLTHALEALWHLDPARGAGVNDDLLTAVRVEVDQWRHDHGETHPRLAELAQRHFDYVRHVLSQEEFFLAHSHVAAVYFSAVPTSDGRTVITPHVRPNHQDSLLSPQVKADEAARAVTRDVFKELGLRPTQAGADELADHARLRPLRDALEASGLVLRPAQILVGSD